MATIDHLGEENTQIADDQILELNVPQEDMDQFCEDKSVNRATALAEIPFKACKSTTGDLRDRKHPL